MPLRKTITDREYDKFGVNSKGKASVRVFDTSASENQADIFIALKTNITTSATKIEFPEEGTQFSIYHASAGSTVWIGGSSSIVAAGSDVAPMLSEFKIDVSVVEGNDNNFYAIVASGSVDIYVIGTAKQ